MKRLNKGLLVTSGICGGLGLALRSAGCFSEESGEEMIWWMHFPSTAGIFRR